MSLGLSWLCLIDKEGKDHIGGRTFIGNESSYLQKVKIMQETESKADERKQ